jgi:hypothetical protein
MENKKTDQYNAGFSFENFLQDDFFIEAMKKSMHEKSMNRDLAQKRDKLKNIHAAKNCIELINIYYNILSPVEIEKTRKAIRQKIKHRRQNKRMSYLMISAVASIILWMVIFHFSGEGTGKDEINNARPDIIAFADMTNLESKANDVLLVIPDEQIIHLEEKETVITYDASGIVVDKKAIAQNNTAKFNQLIVPTGKRSILNLSDGTKVWINSGTRLIYPVSFTNNTREIFVDGEIYIDVATDIKCPFIVRTNDLDIQVLGTKFNITAYGTDKEKKIVLVSGSVQINSIKHKNTTFLTPDQMFIMENGQSQVLTVDTKKHIAWIDGIYYCEDMSLGEIFQCLSRYYGTEITCDPSISNIVYSGKLNMKENLTEILEGIAFTLPISYANDGEVYTITLTE